MVRKVAVVGATGNVGREMLSTLARRNFPVEEVVALASINSKGKEVSYGMNKRLVVQDLAEYDFTGTDIALFSAGGEISKIYAPKAGESGCIVIDNSSYWRMDKDVPLVVPEVNPDAISQYKNKNIIANPNCSTIQMVVALKPLHDIAKIKRVVVSTYQAVSGAGKEAMDELYSHTKKIFENENLEPVKFKKSIPFNVIPQIDIPLEDGSYKEEWKMMVETKKILDPNIEVSATCVRVPVFACHSESINIEFENPITPEEASEVLSDSDGIIVLDRPDTYTYAVPRECAGQDEVYVSRIRKDTSVKNGLNMWVVADNIKKGAALNAVQIAEILVNDYGL